MSIGFKRFEQELSARVGRLDSYDAALDHFERLRPYLPELGYSVRLYSDSALQIFIGLPEARQQFILEQIQFRIGTLLHMGPGHLQDEFKLTEHALGKMKLRCDHDFLKSLCRKDIVEIYSNLNIQTYANFEFFRYSSYSLLDLAVNPWEELFSRSEAITSELMSQIQRVMTTASSTVDYKVRSHVVKERFSEERRSFIISMGKMTPVYDLQTGEREGMIHNLRVSRLEAGEMPHISSLFH